MKKLSAFLVIILSLFMLEAVDPKNTEVSIELELDDEYLIDVNTSLVKEGETSIPNPIGDDGIVLAYDKDSFVLNPTSKGDINYYVSYIFKEYKACKILAKLDGDLRTSDTAPDNERIPFEAEITVGESKKLLKSSDTGFVELLKIASAATKIDERIFGSFALQINPSQDEGKDSLKDKKVTSYTAHLILSVQGI